MVQTRIELDTRGLISAFLFRPGEPGAHIGWPEIARLPAAAEGGLAWLHFNLTDVRACEWIARAGQIPAEASEILLATDSRIRLERIGEGIAGVLADLHHEFDSEPEDLGLVRFYADAGLLITGRRQPLRATDRLRREIIGGSPIGSPIALLAHLLEHLAETFEALIRELSEHVDDIEDRILGGRFHQEGSELGRIRRRMSALRRHLNNERHALAGILPRLPGWCGEEDREEVRNAASRLDSIGQDLDLLFDRGRLLQEEIGSRLSEATNRNLYLLSIVTTIFLPMTLISGIFGINVGGMPWLGDLFGFWWVVILIGGTGLVTLALLHWRRLF
jgi:zinc transporter